MRPYYSAAFALLMLFGGCSVEQDQNVNGPTSAESPEVQTPGSTTEPDRTPTRDTVPMATETTTPVTAQEQVPGALFTTSTEAAAATTALVTLTTQSLVLPRTPAAAIDQTEEFVDQMIAATTAPLNAERVEIITTYLENVIATTRQVQNVDDRQKQYMEDVARDAMTSVELARRSGSVEAREVQLRSVKGALDQIRRNLAGETEKN